MQGEIGGMIAKEIAPVEDTIACDQEPHNEDPVDPVGHPYPKSEPVNRYSLHSSPR